MKTKILAAMALISTSFTPLSMMSPAWAVNPTPTDMQAFCDTTYVAGQEDPSKWRATVTDPTSIDGPSTQVPLSERNVNHRPDTGSSFVYANFLRADNPLTRTGGSVNMWGQSVFGAKIWDNTLYDIEARFEHTVTFYWTCHVEQSVNHQVWVEDPPSNEGTCGNTNGNNNGGNLQEGGNGEGNNGCGNGNGGPTGGTTGGSGNSGNNNGGNLQEGGNGEGNNGCGNGNGGPTGTNENCGGGTGEPTGHYEDNWTWDAFGDFDQEQAGDNVDEGYSTIQSNVQLPGHVEGVNYTEIGEYRPAGVRTLACINPGKKGGTWTKKNGYVGVNCTTTYFNTAVTAYGTTFDTITGVLPSASLPAN